MRCAVGRCAQAPVVCAYVRAPVSNSAVVSLLAMEGTVRMRIRRPEARTASRTRPLSLSSRVRRLHPLSLSSRVRRPAIISLMIVLCLTPMVVITGLVGARALHRLTTSTTTPAGASSIATNIARQSQTTPAQYSFTTPTSADGSGTSIPIDGYFAVYYAGHGGSALLGEPLAPAFPIAGGWVQFFVSGALVFPTHQASTASQSLAFGNPTQPAFAGGVRDDATGIIRLPLVQPLLRAGSLVAAAGAGTPSYASLRRDVTPITLAPARSTHAGATEATSEPAFTYQQNGQSHVGQIIPPAIWQFMNRPDIAPDGWQTDIGLPLTLPQTITASEDDGIHQLRMQVFYHAALLEDDGVPGAASAAGAVGAAAVSSLPTGVAYAQTLGMPAASTSTASKAWVIDNADLLDAPGAGRPVAQLGPNFPVTLSGDTRWISDDLWYAVRWATTHARGAGWLDAEALSFSAPDASAPVWSSFDTLSPDLASYLHGLGGNTGAVVYDETHHRYYTYNMNGEFTVASSMKVPFLLAFLTMTESQGREPNDDEMYLLQTMIENSDNDSAQALYEEMGGMGPIQALLGQLDISGFEPDYDNWGWSTISPLAMVQVLTALHDGRVLTAQDRALALSLMAQIEPDQQTGVGSTAPQGADYWMKDGWVPAPDGLWAMNSSGIVTRSGETYIIAVYSQEKNSLDDGWAIAEHVCGAVGKVLMPS